VTSIILDEAHNIKERATNAAKAAFALQAQYKWCLSGTPLQNRVGELYSLVRFLGADPFRCVLLPFYHAANGIVAITFVKSVPCVLQSVVLGPY
jgi:hypothetical protein